MPTVNFYNRTKGLALRNGVVLVIRVGKTNSQGNFDNANQLDLPVGKGGNCKVSSSDSFRIEAEAKGLMSAAMKPASFAVLQPNRLTEDIQLYVIASDKGNLEIVHDDPDA